MQPRVTVTCQTNAYRYDSRSADAGHCSKAAVQIGTLSVAHGQKRDIGGKRREITESVVSRRKSGAAMACLYNISRLSLTNWRPAFEQRAIILIAKVARVSRRHLARVTSASNENVPNSSFILAVTNVAASPCTVATRLRSLPFRGE